ncbi:hypothetical protein C7M84_005150 [Penaeus vannamei]|uniref:Uncharacterized protein n=1 Tax=Penaeus vannamei TaxID=6689 RepID=A0A3R7PLX0_PENVA|nr:hypothetical protein C7M84_005150 [Penaeus vannamei]
MKYDYVILMSLTLLWFPAPVTLLEVSRKLPLEEESAFLKGGAEFGNRQDIWSSLHTFCDLHCGKNDEMLTEDYQSANMSAANMQIGRRLFQKLYPRASSKRPAVNNRKVNRDPGGGQIGSALSAALPDARCTGGGWRNHVALLTSRPILLLLCSLSFL